MTTFSHSGTTGDTFSSCVAVKILGGGELKAKLKVSAHKFTATAKAAIEAGKTVTVDGKAISKVVPAAGAFMPADGSPSLRIKNYLGNIGAIKIDGKPADLKPYEPKHTPSTHVPTDKEN